ncbi:MAG: FlgD immunoglobulin-like domain containing protein [Ignavibacteriaceae bacterium]
MKKTFTFFTLFFLITLSNSFGYDWLNVLDPQNPWISGPGTVEEAVYTVSPKGLYLEYGVELTFSAANLSFTHADTLEIEFFFDLPQGTIINDLWLWYGEDTLKALVLDQWSASMIYEGIVKRRRDPAILFKKSSVSYEMRIFPMAGDESRKIKLNFLVPVNFSSNSMDTYIPTNLISYSHMPLNEYKVLFKETDNWKNPLFQNYPGIMFSQDADTSGYLTAVLNYGTIYNKPLLQYDNVSQSNIYLNTLDLGGYGYYQMAFLPKEMLGLNTSRKAVVLVDYDFSKSTITAKNILDNLKAQLKNNFTEADSFNLVFSNLEITRASEGWIKGDSASIEAVFNSLPANPVSNYSNLPALINNGINFLNEHGEDGAIILISNSDQAGELSIANQLINDLIEKMNADYPVYCVDYTQNSSNYYYYGNRYYYANEYLYTSLSRITAGESFSIRDNQDISQLILSSFQALDGLISSFDLYTTLENGFCYGRFNISNTNSVYLNRPVMQVGKFNGTMPFKITVSGVYKSQLFSKNITIEAAVEQEQDSALSAMWAGNHIVSLENQPRTNSIVSEIIDYSISEKVLSLFTAFLALEPMDSIEVCLSCTDDDDVIIGVDGDEPFLPTDIEVGAYPNPFNSQVKLNVTIPLNQNNQNITFRIYNILGEVIKTFDVVLNNSGKYEFEWNGINDYGETVSSGIYLFVVQTAEKNFTHKIVLMK